jgi:hypothetical protein
MLAIISRSIAALITLKQWLGPAIAASRVRPILASARHTGAAYQEFALVKSRESQRLSAASLCGDLLSSNPTRAALPSENLAASGAIKVTDELSDYRMSQKEPVCLHNAAMLPVEQSLGMDLSTL